MTPKELSGFKNALETERDTVVYAALQRRQRITVEQSADAFEQINYATERELALAGLSRILSCSVRSKRPCAVLKPAPSGSANVVRRQSGENV